MQIVFYSRLFFPTMGGSVLLLHNVAEEMVRMGHEVTVVTPTPGNTESREDDGELSYQVHRAYRYRETAQHFRAADHLFFIETSLPGLLLALVTRTKYVSTHHNRLEIRPGKQGINDRLRLWLGACSRQIAPSKFAAATYIGDVEVVGNPYDENRFRWSPSSFESKQYDLCFVGRLVEEKGLGVLVKALEEEVVDGSPLRIIVIGDGPYRKECEEKVSGGKGRHHYEFAGVLSPEDVAKRLQESRVQVVPSLVEESFGIVVLESLASGCRVITSDAGALPEAGNGFSSVYDRDDSKRLAQLIVEALKAGQIPEGQRGEIEAHLQKHTPRVVAQRYLEIAQGA